MKKTIITCFLILSISEISSAQSAKDRAFQSIGFSTFTDYVKGPVAKYSFIGYNPTTGNNDMSYVCGLQTSALSLFTFIYRFRYNLFESSDNMAVSLSATPAAGLTFFSSNGGSGGGSMHFNIPLMAGLEFGAGSTYNSTANMGGYFGIGMEYSMAPLFGSHDEDLPDGTTLEYEKTWVEPVIAIGVRYWNKRNKLREINIKYGWKSYDISDVNCGVDSETGTDLGNAMSIRLSWIKFLNY